MSMRCKPLNSSPNSIHVIMENFRRFADELETDDTVYLFEGKTIVEERFDVLLGRLDKNEITLTEFNEVWNRSLLYEFQQLNEVNPLTWTREKLAQASDAVKQQVAKAYIAISKKIRSFVFKAMKQAFAVVSKALKSLSEKASFKIWEGALKAVGLLLKAAAKASRFFGPVFIHMGRAMLLLIVGAIFLAAEAMGAEPAAVEGVVNEMNNLMSIAIDILQTTLEGMGESGVVGGEHAGDAELFTSFDAQTVLNGEVISQTSEVDFQRSNSEANTLVRAQEALVQALHGQISSSDSATPWDLERIMSTLDPEVQEAIELTMDSAKDFQAIEPELAAEAAEAGEDIRVLWDGDVKSSLTDYQQASSGPEGASDFEHTRSQLSTVGTKYGVRGG